MIEYLPEHLIIYAGLHDAQLILSEIKSVRFKFLYIC